MAGELKGKILQAVVQAAEANGEKMVAFIHPETWKHVPEEDRKWIEEQDIEVNSPSFFELEALGLLLGAKVDFEKWEPNLLYFVSAKDWRAHVARSFMGGVPQ